jgi:hypothetical protein
VNNNGYTGVTRIVRNGGSARLDGGTLVIENATWIFARIDSLASDLDDRTMAITITSLRDQAITLVAWHGIADIQTEGASVEGSENHDCRLHLPANKPVTIRFKLMSDKALHWNKAFA